MSASDALVMSDENNPDAEAGQVKFTKDSESIDVNAEQKLIGLTKEQLERYRNDPLWKPVRYTLFALFWLIWLGMFAGAILIVVLSPKCAAKKDKHWSENMVAYQILTPTFKDSDGDGVGDFKGIKEKLNDLRRIGVTTVWPTPLLATSKDEFEVSSIVDPLNVDPRFGEESDLKSLIEKAHDLNLYFVADLPLTISNKAPQFAQYGIGTNSKVRLLNLALPDVLQSVKQTAAKLIGLGVDGLNFAQYGLKDLSGTVNAQRLDQLAADIRRENADRFYNSPENFIFISDLPVEKPSHSINFYSRSLARFPNTPSVCTSTGDFVDCLKEVALSGVNQIKRNASSLPLWQIGDVTHARADTLFGNVGDSSAQVSSLSTAIQLFLPGAVKIYYGEELGLPSASQGIGPQYGQMQWEESEKGFSELTGKHFFNGLSGKQATELNFKAQSEATHSHLKVFKKLAELRSRDEVFTDGEYTNGKIDGLNVFVRSLTGNDKAFLLVANWPTASDKSPRQFTVNQIIKPFNLKVASAEFLIDHPLNEKNQWHIELDTKLTINPYEFALVRVQVVA